MEELQGFFTNILQILSHFFNFIKEVFGGTYPWADPEEGNGDGDGGEG